MIVEYGVRFLVEPYLFSSLQMNVLMISDLSIFLQRLSMNDVLKDKWFGSLSYIMELVSQKHVSKVV